MPLRNIPRVFSEPAKLFVFLLGFNFLDFFSPLRSLRSPR